MASALIVGGGAIGRGFLPWVLQGFEIDIFDSSAALADGITSRGGFTSFMSDGERLIQNRIKPRKFTSNFQELLLSQYDIAFISVGPRNVVNLPREMGKLRCPIFSLENDPATVDLLKNAHGLEAVYFGVPDVITSSTASQENLERDPFAIHTENGVLYLQQSLNISPSVLGLLPEIKWLPLDRLNEEWDAKLYIHNTPHCIAAYLGHMAGCTYLHEALSKPYIKRVIEGVIAELLCALKLTTPHDHRFLESYGVKEVRRFSNSLLFDPISRVAREPLRKLNPSGRLMGALRILLSCGVTPTFLMAGITAALRYSDLNDKDSAQLRELDVFGLRSFLNYHLGMENNSIETQFVVKHFDDAERFLRRNIL